MAINRDLFSILKLGPASLAPTAVTADKADLAVIDLSDYDRNTVVGFMVVCTAQTTLSGSAYFDVEVWEADAASSGTALTSGAKADNDDILGLTENGTLMDSTTMTTFPNLRINASSQVGKIYWLQYRGYKPYVQVQLNATGSPSATLMVVPVLSNGLDCNHKAEVVG